MTAVHIDGHPTKLVDGPGNYISFFVLFGMATQVVVPMMMPIIGVSPVFSAVAATADLLPPSSGSLLRAICSRPAVCSADILYDPNLTIPSFYLVAFPEPLPNSTIIFCIVVTSESFPRCCYCCCYYSYAMLPLLFCNADEFFPFEI